MNVWLWLDMLKRRGLVIVTVAVVTVAVVVGVRLLIPPTYEAITTVRVLLDPGVADLILREDYNQRLLNTYAEVLISRPILEKAIHSLPVRPASLSAEELREKVEVELVPNTELISISVRYGSATLARDLADVLSTLLVDYARDLYVGNSKSSRQIIEEQLVRLEQELENDAHRLSAALTDEGAVAEAEVLRRQIALKEDSYDRLLSRYELARLNESLRANSIAVISPAEVPSSPANALGIREIGLAAVIGVFGGLGLALAMENIDTRIHNVRQMEGLNGSSLLGSVPAGQIATGESANTDDYRASSRIAEAYRVLALNLLAQGAQSPPQVVLVTSATLGEDRAVAAANLACALAEVGQAVYLVDADLRRPRVDQIMGIRDGMGLRDLLIGGGQVDGEVQSYAARVGESLSVIPAGEPVANAAPLLAKPKMRELVNTLKAEAYITIICAPPVLGMADASILAGMADTVVLIAGQGVTKREQLRASVRQLSVHQAPGPAVVFVEKAQKARRDRD